MVDFAKNKKKALEFDQIKEIGKRNVKNKSFSIFCKFAARFNSTVVKYEEKSENNANRGRGFRRRARGASRA